MCVFVSSNWGPLTVHFKLYPWNPLNNVLNVFRGGKGLGPGLRKICSVLSCVVALVSTSSRPYKLVVLALARLHRAMSYSPGRQKLF